MSAPIEFSETQFAKLFRDTRPARQAEAAVETDEPVDLGVVIPVYKGRETIVALCDRLIGSLSRITERFVIVLVDDRSADNVWPLIVDLSLQESRIRGVRLSRNFGQHFAITAGIDHVRARWYAVMDCDLQDAPEDIGKLLSKALEGYDVVVGTRNKAGHGPIKRNASRLFYSVFNLMSGTKLDWSVGNYRVFSDKVATAFRAIREEGRFLPATFSWMGFETGTVELEHHPSQAGSSSYSLGKLVHLASEAALSNSEAPLRFVALFGFAMSVVSIAFAAMYVLKAILVGTPVTGWTSLIVAVSVLGSVQIFMIGLVGLYVGKTFREAKRRPLYLVKEYAGFDESKSALMPHAPKWPAEVHRTSRNSAIARLPDSQP